MVATGVLVYAVGPVWQCYFGMGGTRLMHQVVVIGGGVMGCMTALELLQRGLEVCLIERGQTGREASWAGGGIVTPLYPWRYSEPVSALADWSQRRYPTLCRELLDHTGIDPEFSQCGLLWLDHSEQGVALEWARQHEKPVEAVDPDFIYQQVPILAPGFAGGMWQRGLANVRNPRLMAALKARLGQFAGFTLLENAAVTGLQQVGGRVTGVVHGGGVVAADAAVLAAGAWSGDWLAKLGITLQVAPVKGQMLIYKAAPGWLPSIVLHAGRYAIPRRDGHVLIGSTLEYAGYDTATTQEALESLRDSAHGLLPALAQMQPVGQWAGLRPGSAEGVPFIGPVPGVEGLWVNAGHFRNGLVLAPASCRLLADLMTDARPELPAAPYGLEGRSTAA